MNKLFLNVSTVILRYQLSYEKIVPFLQTLIIIFSPFRTTACYLRTILKSFIWKSFLLEKHLANMAAFQGLSWKNECIRIERYFQKHKDDYIKP